jgi:hypothetical protein
MNVGKLFQVKKYFWLLYPSKDIAGAVAVAAVAGGAERCSQAWSKQFNCNVTFVSPNDIFCLLEQDGEYIKVLSTGVSIDGKLFKVLSTNGELGWMIYPEAWTKGCIEEVKQ